VIAERWARGPSENPGDITRRELYFFNLYRCLEAIIYTGLVFSPIIKLDFVRLTHAELGQIAALAYLVAAFAMLIGTDRMRANLATSISGGLVLDIFAASLILVALSGHNAVPIMLLVNVGVAALLLPRRAFFFALLAAVGVIAPAIYANFIDGMASSGLFEASLLGLANFAVAALCFYLGGHMRATEALAAQRGVDLLNLEQVNDLIIQRMKTGVLLVDQANHILRINEAAWHLIGNPSPNQRELGTIAPELSRRLYHWRHSGKSDQTAVALAARDARSQRVGARVRRGLQAGERPRTGSAARRHAEPADRGDGRSAALAAGRVEPRPECVALWPPAERACTRHRRRAPPGRQGTAGH
jgi:two-component system sensor histidine kinase PilS (NtrC family)